MSNYFPNPTVQAMFLLDETGNDLQIAIALALMNAQAESCEDVRYWVTVADVLAREEQEN
jgi:hypothetical protein